MVSKRLFATKVRNLITLDKKKNKTKSKKPDFTSPNIFNKTNKLTNNEPLYFKTPYKPDLFENSLKLSNTGNKSKQNKTFCLIHS